MKKLYVLDYGTKSDRDVVYAAASRLVSQEGFDLNIYYNVESEDDPKRKWAALRRVQAAAEAVGRDALPSEEMFPDASASDRSPPNGMLTILPQVGGQAVITDCMAELHTRFSGSNVPILVVNPEVLGLVDVIGIEMYRQLFYTKLDVWLGTPRRYAPGVQKLISELRHSFGPLTQLIGVVNGAFYGPGAMEKLSLCAWHYTDLICHLTSRSYNRQTNVASVSVESTDVHRPNFAVSFKFKEEGLTGCLISSGHHQGGYGSGEEWLHVGGFGNRATLSSGLNRYESVDADCLPYVYDPHSDIGVSEVCWGGLLEEFISGKTASSPVLTSCIGGVRMYDALSRSIHADRSVDTPDKDERAIESSAKTTFDLLVNEAMDHLLAEMLAELTAAEMLAELTAEGVDRELFSADAERQARVYAPQRSPAIGALSVDEDSPLPFSVADADVAVANATKAILRRLMSTRGVSKRDLEKYERVDDAEESESESVDGQ